MIDDVLVCSQKVVFDKAQVLSVDELLEGREYSIQRIANDGEVLPIVESLRVERVKEVNGAIRVYVTFSDPEGEYLDELTLCDFGIIPNSNGFYKISSYLVDND